MESLLRSCKAHYLGSVIYDMGLTSVQDLAMCEPSDLEEDLGISQDVAATLIDKAREMSLFETRKAAVQKTWKICQSTFAESATQLFYQHLFQEYPELQTLFISTDMEAQANKLYATVGLILRYLNEVESLIPTLEELGVRHALVWKCGWEYYEIFGECLLQTLESILGFETWTEEVQDAWTWVYNTVAKIMAQAGDAALLERRKCAVIESWTMVQEALDVQAMQMFYHHLFEEFPEVKPLFKRTDMEAQARKLYKTVSLAVEFLDDMEALTPKLQELGARHKIEWHCESEHYSAIGDCLLWTIKTGLGEEAWTEELEDAWCWVYSYIALTMSEAGEQAIAKKKQPVKKRKGAMMRMMHRMSRFRPKTGFE